MRFTYSGCNTMSLTTPAITNHKQLKSRCAVLIEVNASRCDAYTRENIKLDNSRTPTTCWALLLSYGRLPLLGYRSSRKRQLCVSTRCRSYVFCTEPNLVEEIDTNCLTVVLICLVFEAMDYLIKEADKSRKSVYCHPPGVSCGDLLFTCRG